jgi:hypothetical protein
MNTDKELERLQKAIKAVELYKGFTKKIEVMKQNMAEGGILPRRYTKDFCFAVNARDRVENYYKRLINENKLQRNDSLLEVS